MSVIIIVLSFQVEFLGCLVLSLRLGILSFNDTHLVGQYEFELNLFLFKNFRYENEIEKSEMKMIKLWLIPNRRYFSISLLFYNVIKIEKRCAIVNQSFLLVNLGKFSHFSICKMTKRHFLSNIEIVHNSFTHLF